MKSFNQIYLTLKRKGWNVVCSSYFGGVATCQLQRGNKIVRLAKQDNVDRTLVVVYNN